MQITRATIRRARQGRQAEGEAKRTRQNKIRIRGIRKIGKEMRKDGQRKRGERA